MDTSADSVSAEPLGRVVRGSERSVPFRAVLYGCRRGLAALAFSGHLEIGSYGSSQGCYFKKRVSIAPNHSVTRATGQPHCMGQCLLQEARGSARPWAVGVRQAWEGRESLLAKETWWQ